MKRLSSTFLVFLLSSFCFLTTAQTLVKTCNLSNTTLCDGSATNFGPWLDIELNYVSNPEYAVVSGVFNEYNNGTATMTGLLQNVANPNIKFNINFTFSGKTVAGSPHFNTGTSVCTSSPRPDWYYYTAVNGTFNGVAGTAVSGAVVQIINSTNLQIGTGAAFTSTTQQQMSSWLDLAIISFPSNGQNFRIGTEGVDLYFNLINCASSGTECTSCTNNVLQNPSFESNTTVWSVSGGNFMLGTAYAVCGNNAGILQATSTSATVWQQINSITAGQNISFTGWAGTLNPVCDTKLRLAFYNSAGTFISATTVQVDKNVNIDGLLQQYSLNSVVPTGTSYARLEGSTSCDVLLIDNFCLNISSDCPAISSSSPASQSLAPNQTFELNATTTATSPPYSFQWILATTNLGTGQNPYDNLSNIVVVGEINAFTNGQANLTTTAPSTVGTYYYYGLLMPTNQNTLCRPFIKKTITVQNISNLSVATTKNNVLCFGQNTGSATAIATGGTSPYTYRWSNNAITGTINNLTAGTYLVTVTDAVGATATASTIISQPSIVGVGITVSNVKCNGNNDGSASAIAFGGIPPHTYRWTNTATTQTANNLFSGIYAVTTTDFNNCTATASAVITQPLAINGTTIIGNVTTAGGNDGSIQVNATGGTSPFQFSKDGTNFQSSNIFSGLSAGTYTITVKDANSCLKMIQTTILQPNPLVLTTSKTNVLCNGGNNGTISLSASGGTSPYSYLWSNGNTNQNLIDLTAGTYTVSVIDASGSSATTSVSINEPLAGNISTNIKNLTCDSLAKITVSATGGSGFYQYSINSQIYQTSKIFSQLQAGTYIIVVKDNNDCFIGTETVIIEPLIPIEISLTKTDAICGAKGSINIVASGGNGIYFYRINNENYQTSNVFSGLNAGNYLVMVTDGNGCPVSKATSISAISIGLSATIGDCIGSNGGKIIATTNSSNIAYKLNNGAYQISREFNNILTGNYTVYAKDTSSGCTDSVKIFMPEGLKISTSSENIICKGTNTGKITVSASGGKTTNYQYKLNDGIFQSSNVFSNLLAGNYIITVSEGLSCIETTTVSISEPSVALSVSAVVKNTTCGIGNDGTITLTIANGIQPYGIKLLLKDNQVIQTLAANQGLVFQNVSAGNYIVKVFDVNGCEASTSVLVSQTNSLTLTTTQKNISCFGKTDGSITATLKNGIAPFVFSISGPKNQSKSTYWTISTFDNLAQGTYQLSVTDKKGCTISKTIIISQPVQLNLVLTATPTSKKTASDGKITATATGGTPAYSYQLNSGNFQSNNVFSYLKTGNYTVTVKDKQGCKISSTVNVPIATAGFVNDFGLIEVSNLVISPNPIESDNLSIKIDAKEDDEVTVELVNSRGKVEIKQNIKVSALDSEIFLDISAISREDVYTVNVYSANKTYGKGRLVRLK